MLLYRHQITANDVAAVLQKKDPTNGSNQAKVGIKSWRICGASTRFFENAYSFSPVRWSKRCLRHLSGLPVIEKDDPDDQRRRDPQIHSKPE